MSHLKSGTIRKAIGPITKRLETNIANTELLINKSIPTGFQAKEDLANELEVASAKLVASVTSLTDKDKQWSELLLKLDADTIALEEEKYEEFAADGYLVTLERGKELIQLLQVKQAQLSRQSTQQNISNSAVPTANANDAIQSSGHSSHRPMFTKLPKLELPTFKGDASEWKHFWTVFDANIHQTSLSGVEKFSYLRSRLQGAAIAAIDGLPISDEAYKVAIDILKERFQKSPEQLINHLYGQLKRLPTSSNNIKELQRTYDCCEKILRQLKDANEDVESNRSLVLDICSKYPDRVLTELTHRNAIKATSSLTEVQAAFREFIQQTDNLTDMLRDLQPFQRETKSNNYRQPFSRQGENRDMNRGWTQPGYTAALTATDSGDSHPNQHNRPSSPCYFCSGDHYNSRCDRYATAESRLHQLKLLNRCERCMDTTHSRNNCRTRPARIRCHFCQSTGEHPSPLCPFKFGAKNMSSVHLSNNVSNALAPQMDSPSNDNSEGSSIKNDGVSTPCALSVEEQALLATAITKIRNPDTGVERMVRVILDNGCPRTFLLDSVASELNLPSNESKELYISAFGCKRTATHPTTQISFHMYMKNGSYISISANTVSLIVNRSAQAENLPEATQRLTRSMADAMADNHDNEGPPELLIGSDYFWQIISCNRITTADGIYLIPSSLGLLLGGRYKTNMRSDYPALLCLTERTGVDNIETNMSAITTERRVKEEYPDVDEFWDLEKIGITECPIESDDDIAQKQFDESVEFRNGRYNVQWPWKKTERTFLPTNYSLALGRLRSLTKRLSADDGVLRKQYDEIIADQLRKGIIETVPAAARMKSEHQIHYLPHHPIVRSTHSTTKVRIVYDASAKCHRSQKSLNECLYRGPVILPDLCSILIRFRLHKIAIIADIEKAFLQLGLQASQRDVTRFLWFRNSQTLDATDNVAMYRFQRVPFGAISSPFLLGATIQYHLKKIATSTAQKIRNNIYVDNVICGAETIDASIQFYDDAKQIFSSANMNLREWSSNSSELCEHIPKQDICESKQVKVLGLEWNCTTDHIKLQNNNWDKLSVCLTKRDVLKAIASIYDPLGLFQPVTLRAKCFLRELWDSNLEWDEHLSTSHQEKWNEIHEHIKPVFEISWPRCISSSASDSDLSLAVFSDASKDAYATCVYLRANSTLTGQFTSTLVYAKSRLAPKTARNVSMPRLELLGLTIAARAAEFVRASLEHCKVIRMYLFCDSTCVLSWLKTGKPLQRFVDNRIKEIQCVKNAEFLYIQSHENPADICTRGIDGSEITSKLLWWNGPMWLQLDSSAWPTNSSIDPICDSDFFKEVNENRTIGLLAGEGLSMERNPFDIDTSRYSSFRKLVRVTGWCFKFVAKMLNIIRTSKDKQDSEQYGTFLTSAEIVQARQSWVRVIQHNHYADAIDAIQNSKPHQLVNQLNLFLDEDAVLKCRGRLAFADLSSDVLTPALIPKNDRLSELIIADAHEKLFHSGVSHTLNQLRRQYWIPQGRNAVRRIITRCLKCRRLKGHPFSLPKFPALPRERVARSHPFQFVGVDYLGPINVRLTNGSLQKMWCCLFTCLAIRAIHLECITDCTAQTFVECLSRFIARRGCPSEVISDNAPQFRLAKTLTDRTWQKVMTDTTVRNYISENGIVWKFTTELSPWQGGFYERLVGLVKSTFRSVIGRRTMKWEEFITIITETEAIVNSRPITFVYSDLDSGTALRPMDFLVDLPTGTPIIDASLKPEGGDAGKFLLKTWKAKQKRLDIIWKQWYSEYLLSLRERFQTHHKTPRSAIPTPPRRDEVVIVKSEDTPRGQWKLARIVSLLPSRDGLVRSVELKIPNGMVIKRPICHLYQLEVPTTVDDGKDSLSANDETPLDTTQDEFDGFDENEVLEDEQRLNRRLNNKHNANESAVKAISNQLSAAALTFYM